jgi:transposase
MFLSATTRKKDGKEHRYFSVVENKRVSGGRVLQRHVSYLGEINSSQELAWRRSIEVLDEEDKRRFGYSRDHRPDCVQVVIALVVTPEGLPLAYEVLAGNTRDCTTLKDFLARIERQYGKARRVWCMDRGVPTEEGLAQMRAADPPVRYLVGTPKGRNRRCSTSPGTLPAPACR